MKAGKPEKKEEYNIHKEEELNIYVDKYFTGSRIEIAYYQSTGELSVKIS